MSVSSTEESNHQPQSETADYLPLPEKKSARRSLESQFETCLADQAKSDESEGNDHDDFPASTQGSSNLCTSVKCYSTDNLTVDIPEVQPASSAESLMSRLSSRQHSNSPSRTPSFCAAISSSLISIAASASDKKESDVTSSHKKFKSKSKISVTPKVASLPPSPYVSTQERRSPIPLEEQGPPSSRSNSTAMDSDQALCRICHDGDTSEKLVSPCYCTGSVGALHMTCLEKWLGASNTTKCEICKYEFKVERKPRPLRDFLRHPASLPERKNMLCDVVCFIILTPLTVCSAFLCLMGVQYYSQWRGRWEVPGLASLTACLVTIYAIWCSVAIKHHIQVLNDWKKSNQIIKIIYLSPTKGKAVLHTETVRDGNNNSMEPPVNHQSVHSITTAPPRLNCYATACQHQDNSTSLNSLMLRPILRYSVNLRAFSQSSSLNSVESLSHTLILGPENTSTRGSEPLLFTRAATNNISVVSKETYV